MKPEDTLNLFLNQIRSVRHKLLGRGRKPSLSPLETARILPKPSFEMTKSGGFQHRKTQSMYFRDESIAAATATAPEFKRTAFKPKSLKETALPICNDVKDIRHALVKSSSLNVNKLAFSTELPVEEKNKIKKIIEENIQKVKTEFRFPQKTYNAEIKMLKENVNSPRFYRVQLKNLQSKSHTCLEQVKMPMKFKSSRETLIIFKDEETKPVKRSSSKKTKCINEIEKKFGILSGIK
jgi:hypothetical protein